jgi:hypothetical protein
MIYKIPVVGFIYASWKIIAAQHAYEVCHAAAKPCWAEYEATWVPFAHFNEAALWTFASLVMMWFGLQIWRDKSERVSAGDTPKGE